MAKPSFKVGDIFNGIEILEISGLDKPAHSRKYKVYRECCDTVCWLAHNRLLVIKRMKEKALCHECAGKAGLFSREKKSPPVSTGSFPGWGQFLGKMGHRHGV